MPYVIILVPFLLPAPSRLIDCFWDDVDLFELLAPEDPKEREPSLPGASNDSAYEIH